MYGCESWTITKAKHQRIDTVELWCWRRLLRVPWTARRYNQSILKEISPGISLEGMMLKLKFQYFGHLMRRVDSLEKTLMLGGIGAKRRRGRQRMRWLDGITDSMDMMASLTRCSWVSVNSRSWWWTGRPGVLRFMGSQRVSHDWATELNWTWQHAFPEKQHRDLSFTELLYRWQKNTETNVNVLLLFGFWVFIRFQLTNKVKRF